MEQHNTFDDPAFSIVDEPEPSDAMVMTLHFFEQAARGENVAYFLSTALDSVRNRFWRAQITSYEREWLREAVGGARTAAFCLLPPDYGRERIRMGMDAAAELVIAWAESKDVRSARPSRQILDLFARARVLQNDMHNLCLIEEIGRRARASFAARHGGELPGRSSELAT